MFNLGPLELLAILVVALLVFGPDKLPEMGKQVGKAVREFRKFQASMQDNVRDVLEPIAGPIMPNTPFIPPGPTNIKGNIPRSASIQNPEPQEGETPQVAGAFGYYAPVEPAPTAGDTAAPAATEPPAPGPAPAPGPDPAAAPPADGAGASGETPASGGSSDPDAG